METRRFGRTGHMSTVAIFGAAAFSTVSQEEADKSMELIIDHGLNHIDVAPSYGDAESRLGPWLARERARFFVGCKTMERSKQGAWKEMHESITRLQIERFDLYQLHAITSLSELDAATAPGGALDALIEAREAGLTRFLGITGHGFETPLIFQEALRRFDFDSVLFPINYVQYARPAFRAAAEELLRHCRAKDVGTMIIKSITRGPWGDKMKTHDTWYEPFTNQSEIQMAVNFALSQDITGLCTAGDTTVLPLMLQACEDFKPLDLAEQEALIAQGQNLTPLFLPGQTW